LVPLLVGLVLWLKDRAQYLRFVTALLGMCMVGFVFFMLVPTAPPWYAAQDHMLSGVTDLINSQHTLPSAISPFYSLLNPNSTAAFPRCTRRSRSSASSRCVASIHAAPGSCSAGRAWCS